MTSPPTITADDAYSDLAAATDAVRSATGLLDEAAARRDAAILALHLQGVSLRQIARAAGLTHTGVRKILLREGGLGVEYPDLA